MSHPTPPLKQAVWNREPLPHVRKIIAVASGKGGVGKSTVTVQLAHALAAKGQRVGVLDADLYGPSQPRMLGLDTQLPPEQLGGQIIPPIAYGIRVLSAALFTGDQATVLRAPMVTKMLTQMLRMARWGTADQPLDVLLIDTPPGTGDVHLSLAQSVPVDGVLLVTTPQEIAVADAQKSAVMFQKIGIPILGVMENMSYFVDGTGAHIALFGAGGGEKLAAECHTRCLAQLPLEPTLGAWVDAGKNPREAGLSSTPIFDALADRIL